MYQWKTPQKSFFNKWRHSFKELLGLVHNDLCGKINTQSLGGAEYFLAFIDDKTRYVWVYPLKHKDEVFDRRLPFGMEG